MSANGRRFSLNSISDLVTKGRSGPYGDLRLLVLSLGIILLCAVSLLVLQAKKSPEKASALPTSAALTTSPAGAQSSAQEPTAVVDEAGSAVAQSHPFDQQAGPQGTTAGPLSQEEQRRILRKMADQIPEGQTIVF